MHPCSVRRSGRHLFGVFAALALSALLQAACARGARSDPTVIGASREESKPTTLALTAKPRDLDAAVAISLPEFGLAVLERSGDYDEGFRAYELLGIRGQGGLLRAEFEPTGGSLEKRRMPQQVTLSAHLGRFGEPPEERALLQKMRSELRRLAREK